MREARQLQIDCGGDGGAEYEAEAHRGSRGRPWACVWRALCYCRLGRLAPLKQTHQWTKRGNGRPIW